MTSILTRSKNHEPLQIDIRPAIEAIVRDVEIRKHVGYIAACSHNSVVAAVADVCLGLRKRVGLNRVCLSGGVFQNCLLEDTVAELIRAGLQTFSTQVPPNEGGVLVGLAVIANDANELLRSGD